MADNIAIRRLLALAVLAYAVGAPGLAAARERTGKRHPSRGAVRRETDRVASAKADTTTTAATPATTATTEATPTRRDKHSELEFSGRVFIRGALVKDKAAPETVAQGSLQSVRVGAEYRWHDVRGEVETEIGSKLKLKDAFVQLRLTDAGPKVDARAGNFKMPFSAIQLTSVWMLPMADRGLVDNVVTKRLQIAGRAIGAMMIAEWPSAWPLTVRAGVFQGVDDAGTPLSSATAKDHFGQDGIVRVSVKPAHRLEIGVAGSARVGQLQVVPLEVSRGYAGELDATFAVDAGPGLLRGWVEGMLGTSWLVAGSDPAHTRATFRETRGVAAYRIGGEYRGHRYGEVYSLLGALDPDAAIRNDMVIEATGGLTYGAWNAWRLQAELERWRVGSNAPIGIAELGVAPATSTTFLVQFGARF